MQQPGQTRNLPSSSTRNRLTPQQVADFLLGLQIRAEAFVMPYYIRVFVGRFNQEQRGMLFAAPWTDCRLVEVYGLDLVLRCQIPYEIIEDALVRVLDEVGATHGRPREQMVSYASEH